MTSIYLFVIGFIVSYLCGAAYDLQKITPKSVKRVRQYLAWSHWWMILMTAVVVGTDTHGWHGLKWYFLGILLALPVQGWHSSRLRREETLNTCRKRLKMHDATPTAPAKWIRWRHDFTPEELQEWKEQGSKLPAPATPAELRMRAADILAWADSCKKVGLADIPIGDTGMNNIIDTVNTSAQAEEIFDDVKDLADMRTVGHIYVVAQKGCLAARSNPSIYKVVAHWILGDGNAWVKQ